MGLRERKKHQTREALIDAALDLFLAQGYEATTVDQIAAAVEISPRTFFRYFGSKEDLVLYYTTEFERIATSALAARPADEPSLAALIATFREVVQQIRAEAAEDHGRALKQRRVMEADPILISKSIARMGDIEKRLTAEIARREGVDPTTDLRPHLLVSLVTSAMRVGFECLSDAESFDAVPDNVEHALDLTEQVLRSGWDQLSLGSSGQVATKASSPG
ncbi:TetR/AcrR family transcriptional regulator [Sphaerisporangium fuscum]|uniref:TetR/AcrR family transcriptional regulator n=1 Tax=Sphaerisporangium fuscum TaxID=2835868 RepID=UPI001BDD12FD|nr:TetR family transcriptional regulator [Sphaerisporangium fuscum]